MPCVSMYSTNITWKKETYKYKREKEKKQTKENQARKREKKRKWARNVKGTD